MSYVSKENGSALFGQLGVPEEFDLLSIDIDQNTYYIWEGLRGFRPRVVVIEYNSSIPPEIDWKVEYDPDRICNGTNNFGASLKALEKLASQLGYSLVGCEFIGANAFFVRDDLVATGSRLRLPPRIIMKSLVTPRVRRGHPTRSWIDRGVVDTHRSSVWGRGAADLPADVRDRCSAETAGGDPMTTKWAVTGAAGYLGSHVVDIYMTPRAPDSESNPPVGIDIGHRGSRTDGGGCGRVCHHPNPAPIRRGAAVWGIPGVDRLVRIRWPVGVRGRRGSPGVVRPGPWDREPGWGGGRGPGRDAGVPLSGWAGYDSGSDPRDGNAGFDPGAGLPKSEVRAGCGIYLVSILWLPLAVFRPLAEAEQRGYLVNLLNTVQLLIVMTTSVVFAAAGWGLVGLFLGLVVGGAVFQVALARVELRRYPEVLGGVAPGPRPALWRLSWPNLLFNLASRLGLLTDNILVAAFLGPAAVTPFVLTQRLIQMASAQVTAIGGAGWAGLIDLHYRGEQAVFARRLIQLTRLTSVVGGGPPAAGGGMEPGPGWTVGRPEGLRRSGGHMAGRRQYLVAGRDQNLGVATDGWREGAGGCPVHPDQRRGEPGGQHRWDGLGRAAGAAPRDVCWALVCELVAASPGPPGVRGDPVRTAPGGGPAGPGGRPVRGRAGPAGRRRTGLRPGLAGLGEVGSPVWVAGRSGGRVSSHGLDVSAAGGRPRGVGRPVPRLAPPGAGGGGVRRLAPTGLR